MSSLHEEMCRATSGHLGINLMLPSSPLIRWNQDKNQKGLRHLVRKKTKKQAKEISGDEARGLPGRSFLGELLPKRYLYLN